MSSDIQAPSSTYNMILRHLITIKSQRRLKERTTTHSHDQPTPIKNFILCILVLGTYKPTEKHCCVKAPSNKRSTAVDLFSQCLWISIKLQHVVADCATVLEAAQSTCCHLEYMWVEGHEFVLFTVFLVH